MTFLFIGRSGCGKGTQAKLLIDFLEKNGKQSVFYVYVGDKIRELVKGDSLTSKLANKLMLEGTKHPDFLAIWAWSQKLVDKLEKNTHLIFDGSPRTVLEAKILDETFEFYKRENIFPILLDVSYDWAKERLLARKRLDDTEERIKGRLEYFEKDVQPAIDYYSNRIIKINGEQSIEDVHQEIMRKIFNDND